MRKKTIMLLIASILLGTFSLTGCNGPPKKVKVPNLISMDLENAIELIESVRLRAGPLEGEEAPEFSLERIVYHQDPVAGTRVKKGTSVLITHYGEKSNPYAWVRGLLTLNPLPPSAKHYEDLEFELFVPSLKLTKDLGFNLLVPYAATVPGWKGPIITRSMRPGDIIARFTNDEPACRKHDPYRELELYKQMKVETPGVPVGSILCGDIGCGHEGTALTKEEYRRQWVEVINQFDYVCFDIYPYRPDWPDPLEKLEEFHQDYKQNITVPVIIIVQAHWGYHGNPTLTRPNPMEQVKFWVERGYGYIVYPWKDELNGVCDMQQEWRLANEWASQR